MTKFLDANVFIHAYYKLEGTLSEKAKRQNGMKGRLRKVG